MVQQLWDAGVITVASSGNRPTGDETGGPLASYSAFHPGEDASADVHPAGYPPALSVGTSMTGLAPGSSPQAHVLQNSGISVVAPTAGGVSYSVLGGTCLDIDPATSWGARRGQRGARAHPVLLPRVAGPRGQPAALHRQRPAAAPNDLLGAGEVQPYEALTRPLQMDADGRVLNSPVAQERSAGAQAADHAPRRPRLHPAQRRLVGAGRRWRARAGPAAAAGAGAAPSGRARRRPGGRLPRMLELPDGQGSCPTSTWTGHRGGRHRRRPLQDPRGERPAGQPRPAPRRGRLPDPVQLPARPASGRGRGSRTSSSTSSTCAARARCSRPTGPT